MHVITSFTSCTSAAEFLVRMHDTSTVCQVGECELLCMRIVGLFGPEHDLPIMSLIAASTTSSTRV